MKTWGSASTLRLSLHPRGTSLQTGENAPRAKTLEILRILTSEAAGAAVNKTDAQGWGRKVVAPRKTWFPTTSPSHKAATERLQSGGH